MQPLDRRSFLRNVGLATAAVWAGPRVLSNFSIAPAAAAVSVSGTTLEASIVPASPTAAYTPLTTGPGWPTVVRAIGVEPKAGREDRRVPLASIVHLTDIHVIDSQSPARVEFLDRYSDEPYGYQIPFSSAWRPQETLTAQISEAMIRRVNDVGAGPITGRPYDCAVCTGDNIDNMQRNEMDWHLALMNGGPVTPNSGAADKYEGVQDEEALTYDPHYWHPESDTADVYKSQHGFPVRAGLLSAAIGSFDAHGLDTRWFTVFGNHDGLLQGNAPENPVFESIAVGGVKVVSLPAGMTPQDFYNGLTQSDPTVLAALAAAPARPVTPDPKREIISSSQWIEAHMADGATGPGPRGHGFTERNATEGVLYYTFQIAPGVTGISMDSVNRGGYAEGSLGTKQVAWLRAQLDAEKAAGRLVIVFSHHGIASLVNPIPDPPNLPGSDPERVNGAAVEALLHEYANVIAWVNGHTHVNKVTPRPHPTGANQGFWEISTAAHVDWPQQARLIEVVDNKDGTISIFGTLVDHDGDPASGSLNNPVALASVAREVSFNDPQANMAAVGSPEDRNVELLLAAPPVAALGGGSGSAGVGAGSGAGGGVEVARGSEHPATGVESGGALALGAALLGGAIALRERGRRTDAHVDRRPEEA